MATPNTYSLQLIASLLDGNTVVISPGPGSATTGSLSEAYGGLPFNLAAGETDYNLRLGTLSDPKFLAVWANNEGVSFKLYSTDGTAVMAYPLACLSDVENGLNNVSEIWLTNSNSQAVTVTVLAAE